MESRTLEQIKDVRRMSHMIWIRGGTGAGSYPLMFAIEDAGSEFYVVNFDKFWDLAQVLIDQEAVEGGGMLRLDGTINRDVDGNITSVVLSDGSTKTLTRVAGVLTSVEDALRRINFIRDGGGNLTGWTVEEL